MVVNQNTLAVFSKYRNKMDRLISKSVSWFLPYYVTPNEITVFRFISIPLVLYLLLLELYLFAGIAFFVAAYSDAVDGAIARTTNRITKWGILYDPLADKLLVGTTVWIMVSKYINVYFSFLIISIELVLICSALFYRKFKEPLSARFPGKAKMVCQSVGIVFLFIYIVSDLLSMYWLSVSVLTLGVFFGLISLFVYRSV